jgi:Protein of unknown function (DUF1071)
MSKSGTGNPSGVPGTTVESQSSATNIEWNLLKLNVNEHTEKKQNLTYLSWAWAWQEALKADPKASFKVHTFSTAHDGATPVMNINGTGMVWVDVTLNGTTRTGFLPVMDHRNKPIPEPDAFQVNTALMRCMTKTLALFGLGLYIYAGEDLPEGEPEVTPEAKKAVQEPKVDANLALFAEKMKEMVTIATTKDELREFWKANLPGLDSLKTENPDLFKSVLKTFKDAQSQMEQA